MTKKDLQQIYRSKFSSSDIRRNKDGITKESLIRLKSGIIHTIQLFHGNIKNSIHLPEVITVDIRKSEYPDFAMPALDSLDFFQDGTIKMIEFCYPPLNELTYELLHGCLQKLTIDGKIFFRAGLDSTIMVLKMHKIPRKFLNTLISKTLKN